MPTKTLKLQPNIRKAKSATPASTATVAPSKKEKKAKTRVEELMQEMSING